jgi:5-methylcytosine-specific restriction endonuclease McrA
MLTRVPIRLRKTCSCGSDDGYYVKVSGQNVAYCVCERAAGYNVPRAETVEVPRVVGSEPGVKPNKRVRIFERDGNACVECGRRSVDGAILNVAHLISLADGHALGISEAELFADENLYTACEICNLGRGRQSVSPQMFLRIVRARQCRAAAEK